MGQLSDKQFKTFHNDFQELEPMLTSIKKNLTDQSKVSVTNGGDRFEEGDANDYDFFKELYSRGYKIVKI